MSDPLRTLRKGTQGAVAIFLVVGPLLAWHGPNGGSTRISRVLSDTRERVASVHGDSWSAQIGGVSLLDPLAAAEGVVSQKASFRPLLLALVLPVALTVLLGRVFCSWVCPAGFLFESCDSLRRLLAKASLVPGRVRLWRGHKYVLLVAGLAVTALAGIPVLSHVYPPALAAREVHDTVFGLLDGRYAPTGALLFLFGIVLFELLAGRRAWCRSLCPGGALYCLLGSGRLVRIRREAKRCTDCADCIVACPIGLDPMHDRTGVECDNCRECVASCPEDALSFALARADAPAAGTPSGQERPAP